MSNPNAAWSDLASYLRSIGLGNVLSVDGNGNPRGWLWEQIQQGYDTRDELYFRLQQTPEFKSRFGIILKQQELAAEGRPVYVMSPEEVIAYERQVRQIFSSANLPPTFYDHPADFHKLILAEMSPSEVQERVQQGYEFIRSAPPEVRQVFAEYYGPAMGESAMVSYFLDPDRATRDLARATRIAYTGGMAQRFDIDLSRQSAARIADLPRTQEGIVTGLGQVARQRRLFAESFGERGQDLTVDTGIAAVFENDAEAQAQIERRVLQRESINRAQTGGALITQAGAAGTGSTGGG